tara:strand:- start:283 stop:2478 length:2196 start_codon:yes stop_codon:yes gene_type:complete
MIKQTFLEARQLGSKTSTSQTNGDYTTMLNQPVIIKEGDVLNLQSAFIDTIDITDNHVVLDEDISIKIDYYMYADMGGVQINDYVLAIPGQTGTSPRTQIAYLNPKRQKSRFFNLDRNLSPITSGQAKGILSTFTNHTDLENDGYEILEKLVLEPVLNSQPYGGGDIIFSFTGINETIQYTTIPIERLNVTDNPTFILDLTTGLTTQYQFIIKTSTQINIVNSSQYNIKVKNIQQTNTTLPNVLVPVLRTKTLSIEAGRYTPEGIVEILNTATAGLFKLRGGTVDVLNNPLNNDGNIFNKESADVDDGLGPHFLTTTDYLPMGEVFETGKGLDAFSNRMFFAYDDGDAFQMFAYGARLASQAPPGIALPAGLNPPEDSYMVGSSQGIQFEYDTSTSKINIIATHTPCVVAVDPASDTSFSKLSLGINYQITGILPTTATGSHYPATHTTDTDFFIETYKQNNAGNVPSINPSMLNTYQTDMGGVLIADLQPRSFWTSLGFNVDDIISSPQFLPHDPKTLTGMAQNPGSIEGLLEGYETLAPSVPIVFPQFNLKISKNFTGNMIDKTAFRSLTSYPRYLQNSPLNTDLNSVSFQGPNYGWGTNFFVNSTTDTFKIDAAKRVIGGDLDSAYYFVEVNLQQNKMLDSNGGEKRTIAGIINRYYSVSSYTSTEGGFSYTHRGSPMVINTLHVRILMPDGSQVQRLGPDNSVFLKLTTEEPLPTPPSPINQKQKRK